MSSSYQKPFATFDDQLALLESRGLRVDDRDGAIRLLQVAGYNTIGGYLYPLRVIAPGAGVDRLDTFVAGASFAQVADLYHFDRELRLLCLDALETVERRLKVAVAYTLGQLDPFAHISGQWHNQDHLSPAGGKGNSAHQEWLANHDDKVKKRGDDLIRAFVRKYGTPLPVWVAVDVMDFGDLSRLIAQLGRKTQIALAREFDILRGVELVSWVRTMCHVRNIAAHHDRLWNRELVDVPTKPRGPEAACFGEVLHEEHWWTRTYTALLVIAYFARQIDPATTWPSRVANHLLTFPEGNGLTLRALGAPEVWIDNSIWS